MSSAGSHYFDEDPSVPSDPRDVTLLLPDIRLTLATDRGVFGYGQIDPGTKALLLAVPAPPSDGDLLDLGCGTGAITLVMARRAPQATVWAVDINSRARDLCAANAAAHAITNVRVAAPEDIPDDIRFAAIWSNPAIRIGKPALHAMLRTWLDRLTADGTSSLVVHQHLGSDSLHSWLDREGYPTVRLASTRGYRILRSHARRVDSDSQT